MKSLVIESKLTPSKPVKADGEVIASKGYLAIWFIFKDRGYDVGKFYDRAGRFVGYYCDIIEPAAQLLADDSHTVTLRDLCLDLWISASNRLVVLDEDEFESALTKGYISKQEARNARKQLNSLVRLTQAGRFPSRAARKVKPLKESE